MAKMPKPEEMIASRASFPEKSWMDVKTEIKAGMYAYPAKVDIMEGLHMPHPHAWQPEEEDWHLPENWEEIIYKALKERLAKHRSLKIFMDTCVRCGACADKCHFFLGTNDPKNMPVLRAELLRSVYRRDFTTAGRHRKRPARTGRQRAGHEGRTAPYHEPASGRPRMPRPRARGRGR